MFDNNNKNDTKLTDTKSTKSDAKRSKREDSEHWTKCPNCGIEYGILGYLATKLAGPHCYKTEMRCSEHCGNTVSWVR